MPTTDVSVAQGRFNVKVWSEGSGPPLLYLHGFDGSQGGAPFLQQLAGQHRVIAPEHPGFGESTGIEEIDDILDLVLYYRELCRTLGLDGIDVVGHSLGGMFAAEFAAICPQLVRRLVLVAPFGLWLDDVQVPDLFVMSPGQLQRATWYEPESPAAQQAMSRLGQGKSGPAAVIERAMNLSAAGKFLWPIPDRGLEKRLRLIQAPTCVLVGDSDKLIDRAYGKAFVSQIPTAELHLIKECGHNPMLEQPARFAELVIAFLAK